VPARPGRCDDDRPAARRHERVRAKLVAMTTFEASQVPRSVRTW
jgi:hypothetical protein